MLQLGLCRRWAGDIGRYLEAGRYHKSDAVVFPVSEFGGLHDVPAGTRAPVLTHFPVGLCLF